MARRIITLTTDFGLTDPYVGTMKGVIVSIAPDAEIVDLTHAIGAQNVPAGAYLFSTAYRYFPVGTIHVIVVDPGVGTERSGLVVTSPHGTFVCPDNGTLSYALAHAGAMLAMPPFAAGRLKLPRDWTGYVLANDKYRLRDISNTFHGRDVFAPAAAYLAIGVEPSSFGPLIETVEAFAVPFATKEGNTTVGQVIHMDHFGNLVTNIHEPDLPPSPHRIDVAGHVIDGLTPHFQASSSLVALMGSNGTLEIAVPNGDAAATLRATVGAEVRVTTR